MLRKKHKNLRSDQDGAVLVEGVLVLPVLVLFTMGLLEFGSLMWQRQQLQVGVRDAARYWSRCREILSCDIGTAREIAFYGYPGGASQTRVPGWDDASELSISPDLLSLPTTPDIDTTIVLEGSVNYQGTPFFSAVFSDSIQIRYWATMRYYGW